MLAFESGSGCGCISCPAPAGAGGSDHMDLRPSVVTSEACGGVLSGQMFIVGKCHQEGEVCLFLYIRGQQTFPVKS